VAARRGPRLTAGATPIVPITAVSPLSPGLAVLAVLAWALGCVLAALTGAILAHRVLRERRRRAAVDLEAPARRHLADWAAARTAAQTDAALRALVPALRALPTGAALHVLVDATDARLTADAGASLGGALRDEAWVARVLLGAGDRRWWRRLEAGRLLALTGTPADAATLRRLLGDCHVAVRSAASRALATAADAALVAEVVRALPAQPPSLQRLQAGELRTHADAAESALIECLGATGDGAATAPALRAWAALAASLQRPRGVTALLPHAAHPDAETRAEVVRALSHCPSPAVLRVLAERLGDDAPAVRAAAAQAAGQLGPVGVRLVPALAQGLADADGLVRLNAALSLAQIGEPGRAALRAARTHGDRHARDTALFAAGLSDGALLELAAA
jgi:HEAT repeat protein